MSNDLQLEGPSADVPPQDLTTPTGVHQIVQFDVLSSGMARVCAGTRPVPADPSR